MKVKELVAKLSSFDPEATVILSSCHGCGDCNEDGLPYYDEVYDAEFKKEGDYPNGKIKNVIVIS